MRGGLELRRRCEQFKKIKDDEDDDGYTGAEWFLYI